MFQQGRQFLPGFHSSRNSGRNMFMVIGTRVKIDPEILHCIGEGICKSSTGDKQRAGQKRYDLPNSNADDHTYRG